METVIGESSAHSAIWLPLGCVLVNEADTFLHKS